MKKNIAFLIVFFACSLYAEVVSPRYDDASAHLGLPSWVTFSGGETVYYPEETISSSSSKSADISLPATHYVNLMGETYKTLRVDDYGRVYFIPDHELRDTLWFGIYHFLKNESFIWKAYDGNEVDENNISQDRFMIVINQSFEHSSNEQYMLQFVIFPDGEMHVQLWKKNSFLWESPSWFEAKYFDGLKQHKMPKIPYAATMELLGPNGLRPGWIAKSMRDEDAADIQFEMDENGKGLHISVDGYSKDLGGVIAYDNSREHPVVGSFSSIDVQTEGLPEDDFLPFYCWYFNEFYGTFDAKYPQEKSFSKGVPSFTLKQSDFQYTWDAYMTKSRIGKDGEILPILTENEISFIKAPAIKFQRVGSPSGSIQKRFDFNITSIKYHLAQLPSVQFLPNRTKVFFKIKNGDGGRFETPGLKGVFEDWNKTMVYEMFKGQKIEGTIKVFPGNEIDRIYVSSRDGGICSDNVQMNNVDEVACGVGFKKISEDVVEFSKSVQDLVILSITYKKCSKRTLTVVPEIHQVQSFPSSGTDTKAFETASVLNGFGAEIQKQEKISSSKYMVSTSYSNDLNQTTYVPMNFVHESSSGDFEYVDLACYNCITLANGFYGGQDPIDRPNALGYAYTEQENYNNKNGVVGSAAGVAKRSFAYNDGNTAKSWSIPVSSAEDFIPFDKLIEWRIEDLFHKNMDNAYNLNYTLTVSRNSEGKFTQKINDSRGLLKSSWYYNGTNPVISLYDYDEYGNLIETRLKNDERLVEENTYDAQGRMAKSKSNDRGLSEFKYDSYGRLKYTRSAMQKAKGEFSATFYDEYGRSVALGIVTGGDNVFNDPDGVISSNVRYVSKTIYGMPDATVLQQYGMPQDLANEILSNMKNVRPNDIGAVVSFDGKGNVSKIVMSSYNVIGMNTDKWIYIGLKNFPAVRLQYEYNDSKEPIWTSFSQWKGTSWSEKTVRTRDYDEKGRLLWIKENGKFLAKYTYTELGNTKTKEYFDNGALIMEKSISADVYGRVTDVNYKNDAGNEIYSTKLGFSNDLSSRVTSLDHSWSGVLNRGDVKRKGLYSYDYNDRLSNVVGSFAASYEFDEIGRMSKKVEGDDGIEFSYANPSYRPSGYSVNGESETKDVEYFKYDASGNIWYDKHNKVVYKNSELGLPVKITTFTNMPSNITLEDVNEERDFANVESVVDVTYDEAGNRLWYSVDNRVRDEKWIEVTLPGIGVFKSQDVDAANPAYELVRQDLVAGAYRDASGNAHFPVLDAQGSVRGYVTAAGLESAYDYYPYGTVVNVSPNAGDDNRRWQDKEFDNEHHKYYFGSRYFDPFFGMWMSPDPAGQFANPYTYGGDPVNFVDPNGEEAVTAGVLVTAAVVGAIIGGSTAIYQCSKYGAGSCAVAVPQAIVVGAAAGAAGAAAGGAVGGMAAGAGEGAIGGGFAGGAAGSATSYIGNGLFTGDMSFGEGFRQTMVGGFSGAISGGVGSSLELSETALGWGGRTGGELLGSAASSVFNTAISGGGNFWDYLSNMGQSMAMGLTSSILTGYLDSYFNKKERYDDRDILKSNPQEGDLYVWGVNDDDPHNPLAGWFKSRAIMTGSGEAYSHVAIIDKVDNRLVVREANGDGSDRLIHFDTPSEIGEYRNRAFKKLGNKFIVQPFNGLKNKDYNIWVKNCTTQASMWTGLPYRNNPGAFARMMLNQSIYYNSASLRSILW
ncbi:RHS repeat-associated core domain-containing protein [Candidatus Saccharibacteria bacterium]|nr:RHS repeat-associated core domain-containing protein [Candidatus Saccharibacteria bacterium]